jgi:hypothetical protein
MAISDWSTVELCVDSDLLEFETDALNWVGAEGDAGVWRVKAKEMIGEKLDHTLKQIEIATDEAEVKDLIGNPEKLKNTACYLTLHLIANDKMLAPGDLFDRKAEMYWGKYRDEYGLAVALLSIDLDESGAIDDTEKYVAPSGVTLKHGG